MNELNPYYCQNIVNGLYVEKVSNNQIRASACCINSLGDSQDTVDFLADPHLQKQRSLMLAHQPVPGCEVCYRSEKESNSSLRTVIQQRRWVEEPDTEQIVLRNIDYNVDPICNAKCIQCSSHYSSAWAAEDQRFGSNYKIRSVSNTRHNNLSETIDLSTVNRLYFNGGEPMLSDEPRVMMQRLQEMGRLNQVVIQFNTNGSIEPGHEMIELWQKCQGLHVTFSIDGTERAFEYIRNPLKWEQFEKVIDRFSQLDIPSYNINFGYTAGIHNIDVIEKTYQWYIKKSQTWDFQNCFSVGACHGQLDIANADPALKQYWLEQLEGQEPRTWHIFLRNRIQSLSTPGNWRKWLERIDLRRNLNWQDSLPELALAYKKSLA